MLLDVMQPILSKGRPCLSYLAPDDGQETRCCDRENKKINIKSENVQTKTVKQRVGAIESIRLKIDQFNSPNCTHQLNSNFEINSSFRCPLL